jgi:hypothetical protein
VVPKDSRISIELNKADEIWSNGQLLQSKGDSKAESVMRTSLQYLRNAYHLSSEDPKISVLLHQSGKFIHDNFGCQVRMEGTTYYEECPVLLSHVKYGFSVGGSAISICSICGKDPWECEHIKGFKYDGVIAKKISGYCNICGQEACDHQLGEIYNNAEAVHIITEMKLDHVSLVERPANPLARITMYTLGPEDILKALPDSEKASFKPGVTVIHCHHCVECNPLV